MSNALYSDIYPVTLSKQYLQVHTRSHSCFTDSIYKGNGLKTLYFQSSLQLHHKKFSKACFSQKLTLRHHFSNFFWKLLQNVHNCILQRIKEDLHKFALLLDELRKCWTLCTSCMDIFFDAHYNAKLSFLEHPHLLSLYEKKQLKHSAKHQLMSLTYGRKFGKTVNKGHTRKYMTRYIFTISFEFSLFIVSNRFSTYLPWIFAQLWQLKTSQHPTKTTKSTFRGEHGTHKDLVI